MELHMPQVFFYPQCLSYSFDYLDAFMIFYIETEQDHLTHLQKIWKILICGIKT